VRIKLTPARDPESKGLIERRNGYFETSFLPGRSFVSPFDFNAQIQTWLTGVANARHLRSIGTTPATRWPADRAGMVALPPVAPQVGLTGRVRLSSDYYVRIDGALTPDLGHAESGHGWGSEMIHDHGPQDLLRGVPSPGRRPV